jgi:hypothetical protein
MAIVVDVYIYYRFIGRQALESGDIAEEKNIFLHELGLVDK